MNLNSGQRGCVEDCLKWYKDPYKQTYEYTGPPGSGKTTIAKELIRRLQLDIDEEVLFLAYTGKAASKLREHGLPGSSIHSALMELVETPMLDVNGNRIYRHGRMLTYPSFKPKVYLPRTFKVMYIDEATFIDSTMAKVILSFGLPCIIAGDMDQLGPVEGEPYFLKNPDYRLIEIMRQEGKGILELAQRIRLDLDIPDKTYKFGDDCFIIPKEEITDTILTTVEMIICTKNKTRNYFNEHIRNDIFKITNKLPVRGEKVICRNNNWTRLLYGNPLINGTSGYIINNIRKDEIDIRNGIVKVDFRPDFSELDYHAALPIDIDFFTGRCGEKEINSYNKGIKLEKGYALSCHLCQGSEYPSVLYWDEPWYRNNIDTKKIRYTAATRAKQILIYAI